MPKGIRITEILRDNDQHINITNDTGGFRDVIIRAGQDTADANDRLKYEDVRDEERNGARLANPNNHGGGGANNTIRDDDGGVGQHDTDIHAITSIKFQGLPGEAALKFIRLLALKARIKDKTVAANTNSNNYTIKHIYYYDAATPAANFPNTFGTVAAGQIVLPATTAFCDENGAHKAITNWEELKKVISIDVVSRTENLDVPAYVTTSFSHEIDIWEKTEKLISDLEQRYVKNSLPEASVMATDLQELKSYLGNAAATAYIDNGVGTDDANLKKIIRDLDIRNSNVNLGAGGTHKWYDERITALIAKIEEFKVWKGCGVKTIKDILRANANGFIIRHERNGGNVAVTMGDATGNRNRNPNALNGDDATDGQTNIAEIKKQIVDGKYRGFPIFSYLQGEPTAGGGGVNDSYQLNLEGVVDAAIPTANVHFKKENIENLRTVFPKKDPAAHHADYPNTIDATSTDKWIFKGFEPNLDNAQLVGVANAAGGNLTINYIVNTVTYNIYSKANTDEVKGNLTNIDNPFKADGTTFDEVTTKKFYDLTKGCFDIMSAGNENAAIDVFFKDFDGAPEGQRQGVLDNYLLAAQFQINNANSVYRTDKDIRKKINDVYKELKNFLNYFDVDYSSKNKNDVTILNKADEELRKYKNPSGSTEDVHKVTIRDFWERKKLEDGSERGLIDKKLVQITKALSTDAPKDPNDDKIKNAAEVETAKGEATKDLKFTGTGFKEVIEKIFDDNKTALVGKNKAILTNLKSLIVVIDRAFKDGKEVEKKELEEYKNSTDDDKKEAWKLANGVQYEKENLADKALNNAVKEPKKKKDGDLKTAKENLKKAIQGANKAKTDNIDTIVENIVKDKDAAFVDKATEVVKKASELLGKSKGDAQKGLSDFKTYIGGDRSDAKSAVNTNLKHEDGSGYIDAALKHGESVDKKVSEVVAENKLDEPASRSDAETKISNVKNSEAYGKLGSAEKEEIDKKVFPRTLLMGALAGSSVQEEKDLAKIVAVFIKKANIDSCFSTKDEYEDLNKKLEKLKKYQSGDNYKKLNTDDKAAFDSLVTELGSKVDKMAKEFKTTNSPTDNKSFWKKPGGIILIIVIIVAVLTGIAYLIKINSSSDEAGEGESE